ncbi:LOW QUALITY PROTEIN: uncharacterized protein LOC117317486 [Pecten maximus]|uniref:LOW QUALITY PROTEIN: uncharacterized protein LOC117317486 n=1 Tax=Pecten maximus TaxID=6579 RepID=UPI001458CE71|nr:LOW QUALITY PROTEIN: uncharacterized protein LOC117317486 [Pecten maximus]
MEKKTQPKVSKRGLPVQKPKVCRPKVTGVKSRVKAPPLKQKTAVAIMKNQVKTHPAPIPEPGFAMYSTDLEEAFSFCNEKTTCAKVLTMLRNKHKADPGNRKPVGCSSTKQGNPPVTSAGDGCKLGGDHPAHPPIVIPCVTNDDDQPGPVTAFSVLSGGNTPFNDRLASSTPDPDRPQIIPERDTNSTQKVPFRDYTMGTTKMDIQKERYFPGMNSQLFSSHGYKSVMPPGGGGVSISPSQGFVSTNNGQDMPNSWDKRESDIGAFQAYIARESTGFSTSPVNVAGHAPEHVVAAQGKNQSGSSVIKVQFSTVPQNTGNSSGTEYIYLPQPVGTVDSQERQIPPGFQYQNGLYQIRPHGPMTAGAPGEERQIHNAHLIPVYSTHPPESIGLDQGPHKNFVWEIPERDNGPMKSPRQGHVIRDAVPDTISTIDGSVSGANTFEALTPRSTVSESTNPLPSVSEPKSLKKKSKVASSKPRQNIKGKKQNSSSNDGTENKTGSFQTQTSQISAESTAASQGVSSTGTLYHLIHTDKGKELVPVSLVHYPSFVNIPGGVHHDSKGQGHSTGGQGQGEGNFERPVAVSVMTNEADLASLKHQSLSSAVNNEEQSGSYANPNPWSGVRLDAGMKRVRYLLGEMKECGKINKDVEIGRLAREVEKSLDSIPQLSATFSLQAEVDLSLQPLRNENAQLRRKLRLANQNMREYEHEKEKATTGVDFDVLHLQASNSGLQRQVKEEMEDKVKLAAEVANQHNEIQRMKVEKNKLLAALSEKETDELKVKQECLMDAQKFRKEVEAMNRQIEAIQLQQEASDQENHILQVSLQQRDTEISRLQEMVQDMKSSVSELIQELDQAGDNSILSNNSYRFQKLLQVLGGEPQTSSHTFKILKGKRTNLVGREEFISLFETKKEDFSTSDKHNTASQRNPVTSPASAYTEIQWDIAGPVSGTRGPVKTLRFDPREIESSEEYQPSTKLTEQALASHNRSLGQENKGHNYDTKREFTGNAYVGTQERVLPRQRRRSSSPHGRRESNEGRHRRALSSSPRQVERMSLIDSEVMDRSLVNTGQGRINTLHDDREAERHGPQNRVGYLRDNSGIKAWGQQVNFESNRSDAEQSRYSVTDYFKKYQTSSANDDSYKGLPSRPWSTHQRTLSQPARLMLNKTNETPIDYSASRFTNSRNTDSNFKQGHSTAYGSYPRSKPDSQQQAVQDREYQGGTMDNSISAIDDDNFSSVSGSGKTSSSTITDKTFRKGIATLDANILKLQLALQRTKSMLS